MRYLLIFEGIREEKDKLSRSLRGLISGVLHVGMDHFHFENDRFVLKTTTKKRKTNLMFLKKVRRFNSDSGSFLKFGSLTTINNDPSLTIVNNNNNKTKHITYFGRKILRSKSLRSENLLAKYLRHFFKR